MEDARIYPSKNIASHVLKKTGCTIMCVLFVTFFKRKIMEDTKKENPQENEKLDLTGHGKAGNDETIIIPKGTYNPDDESIIIDADEKEISLEQYKQMLGYLKKNGIEFSEEQIDEIEKLLEKDYGNNLPINLKEFLAQF